MGLLRWNGNQRIRTLIRKALSRSGALIIGIMLLNVTFAIASQARERWPGDQHLPFDFYSLDLTPIEVTLRNFNDPDAQHKTILRIPRAYILFAHNYDAGKVSQLPDVIETDELQILLTYPDGRPLSVQAHEIAAERHIDEKTAIDSLRLKEYSATVHYVPPGAHYEDGLRRDFGLTKVIDRYQGLAHARSGLDDYLGEPGVDTFVYLSCSLERNPEFFCAASVRVGPTLTARVSFADFRLHGGRAYANERIRKFREIVCRYAEPPCR
jgi:hypothetical protein